MPSPADVRPEDRDRQLSLDRVTARARLYRDGHQRVVQSEIGHLPAVPAPADLDTSIAGDGGRTALVRRSRHLQRRRRDSLARRHGRGAALALGQNPEEDYMVRTYNIPKEAAMGYPHTLYPEYRKTLRPVYTPPAACGRYCCGWIERQGLPGAAPGLTCNDGNPPPALRKSLTSSERLGVLTRCGRERKMPGTRIGPRASTRSEERAG